MAYIFEYAKLFIYKSPSVTFLLLTIEAMLKFACKIAANNQFWQLLFNILGKGKDCHSCE